MMEHDRLVTLAKECTTRPQDAAFWDKRMYTTHGPVYSWAERGDDVLSESNFHCILRDLQAKFPGQVEDISVGHWLVGSLRQILVEVYDEHGEITPAFAEAAEIVVALEEEYPVYDESDFSDREYAVFEKVFEDAFAEVSDDFGDVLEDDERDKVREITLETLTDYYGYTLDFSWDDVTDAYVEAREEVFGIEG